MSALAKELVLFGTIVFCCCAGVSVVSFAGNDWFFVGSGVSVVSFVGNDCVFVDAGVSIFSFVWNDWVLLVLA